MYLSWEAFRDHGSIQSPWDSWNVTKIWLKFRNSHKNKCILFVWGMRQEGQHVVSGASKWALWTQPSPPPANFYSISCRFWEKMAKLIGFPRPGEFWIRHWLCHMLWSFTTIRSARMDPGFRRINQLDPTFPCFWICHCKCEVDTTKFSLYSAIDGLC